MFYYYSSLAGWRLIEVTRKEPPPESGAHYLCAMPVNQKLVSEKYIEETGEEPLGLRSKSHDLCCE